MPTPTRAVTSRDELLTIQSEAAAFYRRHLDHSWVPQYLNGRGLDGALDDRWNVGHAPAGWTTLTRHLTTRGHRKLALLESGMCLRARTGNLIDRFRDRAMLPIRNQDGETIAFTARRSPSVDDGRAPKYLNSPATSLYTKGAHLYGFAEAAAGLERGARAVLVEGALDAIAVTDGTGGRCVGVAPCGTALTEPQAAVLAALPGVKACGLVVATDPDPAGRGAAERAHALLSSAGVRADAAELPAGLDPAALLHDRGPAELTAALLDRTRPLLDVVVDRHLYAWSERMQWSEGRIGAVRDVAAVLAGLPRDQARRQVDRVASRVGIDPTVVQREVIQRMTFPTQPTASTPRACAPGPPTRGVQTITTARAHHR